LEHNIDTWNMPYPDRLPASFASKLVPNAAVERLRRSFHAFANSSATSGVPNCKFGCGDKLSYRCCHPNGSRVLDRRDATHRLERVAQLRLLALRIPVPIGLVKVKIQIMPTERDRIEAANRRDQHWRRWGPYLAERSWGNPREDYSPYGTAWEFFTHDHARSRAYRWTEDGIAGICDNHQRLCFAFAFWNGRDPILKERLFGLGGNEGNHGEDVKEYYFYLDNVPTHSYMKYLYKYPQLEFPYAPLLNVNRSRSRAEQEYELIDTGAFREDRYFDIFVE
jgi:hypothetical protein